MKNPLRISLALLVLAVVVLGGSAGCVGPDAENTSARPWNQPRGFDTGVFGNDYGRRPY